MEHNQYIKQIKRKKRKIQLARIMILVIFIIAWELASGLGVIDKFFFSSPSGVIKSLTEVNLNGNVLIHTGVTLYETIISFVLTIILSLLTAVLLWMFTSVSQILEPYLVALNSLPKSALAPLLIVWLGTGTSTIIIAGMSVALFGSIINLYYGFRENDTDGTKLIYTLGGNKACVLRKIILPGSIPIIISNLKVNIGLCLVGVIIGEFLSSKRGLGYLIIYSTQVFKLDWLIMSILILCIIAMALYFILQTFEKVINRHYNTK